MFHKERTTIELTDADIDAEWLTGFPDEEPPTIRRTLTAEETAILLGDMLKDIA